MNHIEAIKPETLAAKMAAIQDFRYPDIQKQIQQHPKLVELLWFLQAVSHEPGGLMRFTAGLIEQFSHRIGTEQMVAAASETYTAEQCLLVLCDIPTEQRWQWFHDDDERAEIYLERRDFEGLAERKPRGVIDRDSRDIENPPSIRPFRSIRDIAENLESKNRGFFHNICLKEAASKLGPFLASLCNHIDADFSKPWYFHDLFSCLLEAMALRASQAKASLAETIITRKVFKALDFAAAKNCMVMIQGNSRFGKTQSVHTWCNMHPGRARLVQTPFGNSMGELYINIADALHIDTQGNRMAPARLRSTIEFVLRHSRLFLVMDEAQFLLPSSFGRNTAPARLNFIRTEIVDKGLPLALVVTPQSYTKALAKFVGFTGYAMEQFIGRIDHTCLLPSELDEPDMLAIARFYFPEASQALLEFIVAKASICEG